MFAIQVAQSADSAFQVALQKRSEENAKAAAKRREAQQKQHSDFKEFAEAHHRPLPGNLLSAIDCIARPSSKAGITYQEICMPVTKMLSHVLPKLEGHMVQDMLQAWSKASKFMLKDECQQLQKKDNIALSRVLALRSLLPQGERFLA